MDWYPAFQDELMKIASGNRPLHLHQRYGALPLGGDGSIVKKAGARADKVLEAVADSMRLPFRPEHARGWSRHAALNAGTAKEQLKAALTGVRFDGSKANRADELMDAAQSAAFAVLPPTHHDPASMRRMMPYTHGDYWRYGTDAAKDPESRGWWLLDKHGIPVDQRKLRKIRPSDARPDGGDAYRPWNMDKTHAHEDGGVHVGPNATLADARAVLQRVKSTSRAS